jgi:hypothetical protein
MPWPISDYNTSIRLEKTLLSRGPLMRFFRPAYIFVQGVSFKTHPQNNHVLRYKTEIRSRSTPM